MDSFLGDTGDTQKNPETNGKDVEKIIRDRNGLGCKKKKAALRKGCDNPSLKNMARCSCT